MVFIAENWMLNNAIDNLTQYIPVTSYYNVFHVFLHYIGNTLHQSQSGLNPLHTFERGGKYKMQFKVILKACYVFFVVLMNQIPCAYAQAEESIKRRLYEAYMQCV